MAIARKAARKTAKSARRSAKKATTPGVKRRARGARPKGPVGRVGLIEIAGKPATVIGSDIVVGQTAPEFTAQANDWSEIKVLAATSGKVRILTSLPSLATSVCDKETRMFNERAAELGEDVRIIAISADLPSSQKNWCSAAGVERVQTVSDHMDMDFGIKYGTYIKERRWHRRAVFVVDKNDKVTYAAYMPTLGMEPNYEEVLAAARAALLA